MQNLLKELKILGIFFPLIFLLNFMTHIDIKNKSEPCVVELIKNSSDVEDSLKNVKNQIKKHKVHIINTFEKVPRRFIHLYNWQNNQKIILWNPYRS